MEVRGPKSGFRYTISYRRKLRKDLTSAEKLFWSKVAHKQFFNLKFRKQHGIGPYIVDFYCSEKALVVEIDGDTHAGVENKERDEKRTKYLKSFGYSIYRYQNADVLTNVNGVMEDLARELKSL